MASLDCRQTVTDGVALVGLRLTARVPERVTVEPTHEGPVWPPRRHGVPEAGWDGGRWTGLVHPERGRALGYATPADVADPPAEIAAAEPARGGEPPTARDVVRALGDPAPARDAVPGADVPGGRPDAPELPDIEAVEARLERAEALADRGSADRDLADRLAADRAALCRLRGRADRLAERAEQVHDSLAAGRE